MITKQFNVELFDEITGERITINYCDGLVISILDPCEECVASFYVTEGQAKALAQTILKLVELKL